MSLQATTSQTVGPFFRIGCSWLNRDELAGPGVTGERVTIEGRVLDGDGKSVPDALLEIWQANSHGKYAHPDDTQSKAIEPGFQGFGRIPTDDDGKFRFTTIKPGPAPGPDGKMQAPHLAVSVFARGLLRAHLLELFLAAVAMVGLACRQHFLDHFLVAVESLGLIKGSLVVIEHGPFQAVENLLDGLGGRALKIRVLDPEDENAAVPPRIQPAKKRGAQSADVQKAGGTRGKSRADGHGRGSRQLKGRRVYQRVQRPAQSSAQTPMRVCLKERPMSYFGANQRAVSSAVEHCFHTAGVTGSIPVPPTIEIKKLQGRCAISASTSGGARRCPRGSGEIL